MKVLTANPVLIGNKRINSRDMYLSLDASSSKSELKAFQKWVINTKKDKTILGRGGDSGFGDDGIWGDKTSKAWAKYGAEYDSSKTTPAQSGGTGTQAFNENTNPPTSNTSTEDAPKMSLKDKWKAMSTTKKALYIAIPVVAIVVIGIIIKKNR